MNPSTDQEKQSADKQSAALLHATAEAELASRRVDQTLASATPALPTELLLHELQVHQIQLEVQNEELQRRQTELDALSKRYFDLYDLAPVGYCTLNEAGLIVQANLAASTLLGVERSALLKQRFSRFIVSDDMDSNYRLRKALFEKGVAQTVELRILKKGGTPFWAQLVANSSRDGAGASELRIAITDVSERQQLIAALSRSEAELRNILESTSDGILAIDDKGKVLLFNKRFGQLWRLPKALLDTRDDQTLLNHVLSQLTDPAAFINKVQALYASDFEGVDTVSFSDGRIFERFTSPLHSDSTIIGRIWSFRDITERRQLEEQVNQLAFHDTLTQLPNRRLLFDRLNQTMSASKRSGNYSALMMLDLDHFKPLNDAHGHHAGDLLLIEVARRLNQCVREIDTVARIGGDEFVVMIGELDTDRAESARQAAEVAEKIRVSLAMPYRLTLNEGAQVGLLVEHCCSASIGVVLFLNHGASQADILHWADTAMYQAKEAGRDAIRFA